MKIEDVAAPLMQAGMNSLETMAVMACLEFVQKELAEGRAQDFIGMWGTKAADIVRKA